MYVSINNTYKKHLLRINLSKCKHQYEDFFISPSEYEFKVLFSSSPLHKESGLDDISIFQPKRLHRSVGNRSGGGIFSFIAKRVLGYPLYLKLLNQLQNNLFPL